MPEAARDIIAGGAQRRGIDGAEHSPRIDCVMAAIRPANDTERARRNYADDITSPSTTTGT